MNPALRGQSDWAVQIADGTVTVGGTPTVSAAVSGTPTYTQAPFSTLACGEIIVGTAAAVFPTVAAKWVRFKMGKASAGTVYVGAGTAVTAINGTADATTGLELVAGDDTGWIPISNVNKFYGIASADGQSLTYWVVT